MLPEPVSSFESIEGDAVELDVARAGVGTEAAMDILQLDVAGAGLGFHFTLAGLLSIRCRRSQCSRRSCREAGGVNVAGAGGKFGIVADTLHP